MWRQGDARLPCQPDLEAYQGNLLPVASKFGNMSSELAHSRHKESHPMSRLARVRERPSIVCTKLQNANHDVEAGEKTNVVRIIVPN